MDSKLVEVWQTAAGSPFLPTVGKNSQFLFALILLFAGLASFGIFALSKSIGFHAELLTLPTSSIAQH